MSDDSGPDPDAWLVTFGDLITLLLTFFVLMLSMSSMDNKALKIAFDHFGGKPGLFAGGDSSLIAPVIEEDDSGSAEQVKNSLEIAIIVEGALKTNDEESIAQSDLMLEATGEVRIKGVPYGHAIVFSGNFVFGWGSASIRVSAYPVLDSIAKVLRKGTQVISVQGHTDNQESPFDPKYRDRWDLSAGRAVNVVKYLIQNGKINPVRISAVGYGESRPEIKDKSEGDLSRNRRVEIVVTDEKQS